MLSSIFKSFQREEQKPISQTTESEEEDGFLVVGQTKSERTTVITSEFNMQTDRPPSYMEITEDQDVSGNVAASNYGQFSTNNTQTQGVPTDMDTNYAVTPIHDVPFSLNPSLKLMWGVAQSGIPFQRSYDPSKYEYDFSLEYSIVNTNFSS